MQKLDEFYQNLSNYVGILEQMKISGNKILQGMFSGIHKSPYFGFGADFEENRGYNYGDNIKLINWPLWARTEKLFIKKYKETTNSDIVIILDNSLSMGYPQESITKFYMAKLLAGLLGIIFFNQMDRVGLYTISSNPIILEPARGSDAKDLFIQNLINLHLDDKVNMEQNLTYFSDNIHKRSIVIIISDFIFPEKEVEEGLNHIIYGNHLTFAIRILHHLEVEPKIQKGLYYDPENKVNKISINSFLQKEYQDNLNQWQKKIDDILMKKEVLNFKIHTKVNLLEFLKELEQKGNEWNF